MNSSFPIEIDIVEELAESAVKNFFGTMLDMQVTLDRERTLHVDGKTRIEAPFGEKGEQVVVGNIGFVGRMCGLAYLFLRNHFAQNVASRLLGISMNNLLNAEGDEIVNDVVGELSNMIIGSFKNQLCDLGYNCRLTIPSILRGSNFTVEPVSTASRSLFYFKCDDNALVLELLMKAGDAD